MGYEDEKRQIFTHYTPVEKSGRWVAKCADCGEEDLAVLTLHHINGGGNKDRDVSGWGSEFLDSLRRRGLPDGFEVLCYNCHKKRHKKR